MANKYNEKDVFHIRKTPALNRFLYFLSDCVSEGDIDQDGLDEIKSLMPIHEKHTYHLVLSAFIADEDLHKIFSENPEDALNGLSTVIDCNEIGKLDKKMYLKIVLGLGLIQECLCMILVNPSLKIMCEVAETLVIVLTKQDTLAVVGEMYDIILSCLVKLARVPDEKLGRSYLKCLENLLEHFATEQLPEVENYDKLITLFRLIGISFLQEDDYHKLDLDEISTLLHEWQLDGSVVLEKSVAMKVYEFLFVTKFGAGIQKRFDTQILLSLDNCMSSLSIDKLDINNEKQKTVYLQNLTLASYMGGCAYFIKLLLQKYCDLVNIQDLPTIIHYTDTFVKDKPKMKENEIIGESQNFSQFCQEMNEHGKLDIYKKDWILKLLSYSIDDILGTADGNAIVEEFIIGADYDLIIQFVKKIRDADQLDLTESQKELILKILTQERTDKEETENFIKEMFQDGVSNKLVLKNFNTDVNTMSLQLRSIEIEEENPKLAMHEMAIIRLCLQDPLSALTKLLGQSVRMEYFRALGYARPLFNLKFTPKMENVEMELPHALIIHCFSRLLKHYPDYPNVVYDSLSRSMEGLISQNIICERDILVVLKYRILRQLDCSHKIVLPPVTGYVSLLENFTRLVSDKELIDEIWGFSINLNRFFCLYTSSKMFVDTVRIKDILTRIKDYLSPSTLGAQAQITDEMREQVEDCLTIFDQGILYIRCIEFRPLVKKILGIANKDLGLKEFVQICVLPWILNSGEEQFNSLVELIFNVAMSDDSNLCAVKNLNKANLLNDTLLFMYACCIEMNAHEPFLHTLRFYGLAVKAIQEGWGETEWCSLFETLLMVGAEMSHYNPSENKRRTFHMYETVGLHHVLSYLLSKLEEFGQGNLTISNYDSLMFKLSKFNELGGKCESVRWVISEKLNLLRNSCVA